MYNEYFSLNHKPFQITADPKFLWLGEKHKEALATLRYGIIDNRGFLLMTGEVGTGKTVLINRLQTLLDEKTVVATLKDPDLDSLDFYNVLADEFGMNRTFTTKGQFLIHFRIFLYQCHNNQQQVLLIIDESQRLKSKIMDDIRTLSNIELHDQKLINIFFVGQQELNNNLMTPENRALSQRITVRYHLEALDEDETGEYIRHRLEVAGTSKRIFNKSAVNELFNISRGIPRLINIICDHALLTAFTQKIAQIDGDIIKECAEELRIPVNEPKVDAASFRIGDGAQKLGGIMLPATVEGASVASKANTEDSDLSLFRTASRSLRLSQWLLNIAAILVIIGLLTYIVERYTGQSILDVFKGPDTSENNLAAVKTHTPMPYPNETGVQAQPGGTPPTRGEVRANDINESSSVDTDQQALQNGASQAADKGDVNAVKDAETQKINQPQPLIQEKIIIPFTLSSNEIDAANYPILDRIAGFLTRYPEKSVFVRGYTDIRGPDSYNENMSFFRANVVKSYLVGKGVSPIRIVIYAMGGANPIASNDSAEGRKKNRRVEIELLSNY